MKDVKKKIVEKYAINFDSFVIVYKDDILKNDQSLQYYGI